MVDVEQKSDPHDAKYILNMCVLANTIDTYQFSVTLTPEKAAQLESGSGPLTQEEYDDLNELAVDILGGVE
jgi:hypothetical protein